jgi:hypothetical protein
MSAQSDFCYQMDRAANAVLDATCCCRSAGRLPLPSAHRRTLRRTLGQLIAAQEGLFKARNTPWEQPSKTAQLELL